MRVAFLSVGGADYFPLQVTSPLCQSCLGEAKSRADCLPKTKTRFDVNPGSINLFAKT
jgi:hypothetical protein